MNSIKKAIIIILLLPSILFADEEAPSKMGLMFEKTTARPAPVCRNHDFFTTASFIFWQPSQENMQLGVVSNNSAPLDLVNGYVANISSTFQPGFKVGFGMNYYNREDWDTFIEYTWFQSKESVQVCLDPNNIFLALLPAWQIPLFLNPQYDSGFEVWNLSMNLIDWDFGRGCNIGGRHSVRPFIGIRGASIKQAVDVDYLNQPGSDRGFFPSTFVDESIRSWGIGPRLGAVLNLDLHKGVRFIAGGEWDILYTQYRIKSSQKSDTVLSNQYIIIMDNINYLRAHTNIDLGFAWGRFFCDHKFHLDLLADYSFQVFFDQNMFPSIASAEAVGKITIPNGNLYIQGLTLTIRFDF